MSPPSRSHRAGSVARACLLWRLQRRNPPPASSRGRIILGKDRFGRVERGSECMARMRLRRAGSIEYAVDRCGCTARGIGGSVRWRRCGGAICTHGVAAGLAEYCRHMLQCLCSARRWRQDPCAPPCSVEACDARRGSQALAPAGNCTDCVRGWAGGRRGCAIRVCFRKLTPTHVRLDTSRSGAWLQNRNLPVEGTQSPHRHPTVTPEREANSHWPDARSGSTVGTKDGCALQGGSPVFPNLYRGLTTSSLLRPVCSITRGLGGTKK
jgi:hypothetical protein